MRNLKRALSMALAAVMLLGMMVIGASAAGYSDLTDTDEIVNKEAVALLVDLGVIDGKSSGRYDPTGTLERVEFTKLVFGMMMGQNSDATVYEGAGIFSDVDTCWGEGFINYCASIGIVSGVGKDANGKDRFSPYSSLTVAATAKMLLVALGYHDDDRGYNGDAWTVNVMRDAQAMGLLDGVTGQSANDAITRDNAAQMIFNALFATTKNAVMLPGGNVGSETVAYYMDGPSLAESRYGNLTAVEGILENYGDANETVIGGRTVRVESEAADVGTTVVYYTNDNGLVSSVAVSAEDDEILGTSYGIYTLTNLGTRRNAGFIALPDSNVTYVYQNGVDTVANIEADSGKTIDNLVATRGVITELIDTDDNGRYDVVRITEKSVADVTSVRTTTTTDGDVLVSISGITGLTGVNAEDVFGYEDLSASDVALYYQDVNGNWFVEAAESFTGVLTAGTAGSTTAAATTPSIYTIGGERYTESGLTGTMVYTGIMAYRTLTATYWLDNAGNIVWADGEHVPEEYLMVLKDSTYNNTGDAFNASDYLSQVVFTDGTVEVIDVNPNSAVAGQGPTQWEVDASGTNTYHGNDAIFTYTVDANGVYTLTKVPASDLTVIDSSSSTNYITTGRPAVFSTTTGSADTRVFNTDSETVYLVRNKNAAGQYLDSYTVYTGYENVPSMTGIQGVAKVSSTVADFIYINSYTTIDTAAAQTVYTVGSSITAVYGANNTVDYYTIPVLMNGEVTSLVLANNATINGAAVTSTVTVAANQLYTIDRTNSDGEVTVLTTAPQSSSVTGSNYWTTSLTAGTYAASNNILVLGGVAFSYNNNTVVYFVNGSTVTVGTVADIGRDTNDQAQVIVAGSTHGSAANTLASEIYIKVNAESGTTYAVTFNENFTYSLNGGAATGLSSGSTLQLGRNDVLVLSSTNASAWILNNVTATTGCAVTNNGDGTWTLTNFSRPVTVNASYSQATTLTLQVAASSADVLVTVNGVDYQISDGAAQSVPTYAGATLTTTVRGVANGKTISSVSGSACSVWGNGTSSTVYTVTSIASGATVMFTTT